MRFTLINDQKVIVHNFGYEHKSVTVKVEEIGFKINDATQKSRKKFFSALKKVTEVHGQLDQKTDIEVIVRQCLHDDQPKHFFRLDVNSSFLEQLKRALNPVTGLVRVILSSSLSAPKPEEPNRFFSCHNLMPDIAYTNDMTIMETEEAETTCTYKNFNMDNICENGDIGEKTLFITIELLFEYNVADFFTFTPKTDKKAMYQKLLHDEFGADVEIIPCNGNPIKCHKLMLSACSPVFNAMLQTKMKEFVSHQIEINDMTEEGVRAFLAYVYYLDDKKPQEDSKIAFELLNAGHKYNVTPDLETAMKNIFTSKPEEWYDADVAVKFFAFVRNLPSDDETQEMLQMKANFVLSGHPEALQNSPAWLELSPENLAAAMERRKYLLKSKDEEDDENE